MEIVETKTGHLRGAMTDSKDDNQISSAVDVVRYRPTMKRSTEKTSTVFKNACHRYGKKGHAAQKCWHPDKECRKCGKRRHIIRVFKTPVPGQH